MYSVLLNGEMVNGDFEVLSSILLFRKFIYFLKVCLNIWNTLISDFSFLYPPFPNLTVGLYWKFTKVVFINILLTEAYVIYFELQMNWI